MYYAQQDLCDGGVDASKGVPTRDNDPETGKMKAWPSPFILMVDRGGCTFVKKVRDIFLLYPDFDSRISVLISYINCYCLTSVFGKGSQCSTSWCGRCCYCR